MKREELVNLMKMNSHVNLMAEVICSGLASFDMGKPCKFLKAIFTLLEVKKKEINKHNHKWTKNINQNKDKKNKQSNNTPPNQNQCILPP